MIEGGKVLAADRHRCGRDSDIPWMKPLQATSVLAHSNWKSFVDVAAPSDTTLILKIKPVGVVLGRGVRMKLFLSGYLFVWSFRG